jgi:hypothetical protein
VDIWGIWRVWRRSGREFVKGITRVNTTMKSTVQEYEKLYKLYMFGPSGERVQIESSYPQKLIYIGGMFHEMGYKGRIFETDDGTVVIKRFPDNLWQSPIVTQGEADGN